MNSKTYDPVPVRVVDCDRCPYEDTQDCDLGDRKCPAEVQSLVCDLGQELPQ